MLRTRPFGSKVDLTFKALYWIIYYADNYEQDVRFDINANIERA